MSASSEEEAEKPSKAPKAEDAPKPKPAAKPAAKTTPVQENGAPNKPLQFRLDKLERSHAYLTTTRGLTLDTIMDFGAGCKGRPLELLQARWA